MINNLVLEIFGKKSPSLNMKDQESKTRESLQKLPYGRPYSKFDIAHQHITGDLLPALNVFLAKKKGKVK